MDAKSYKFQFNRTHILIIVISFFLWLIIILFANSVISRIRENGYCTTLEYGENIVVSDNGKYIGIIEGNSGKVLIRDKKGKCISKYYSDFSPAEIALGAKSYYLLYREQEFAEESRIVQLDYQSNVLGERKINYINTIVCRNGILFMGKWLSEDDCEHDINRFHNGFTANLYMREGNLQGEIYELEERMQEKQIIEGIELFYHSSVFFSDEPELDDYPGMITDVFYSGEKIDGIYKRAEKNQELLSKKIYGKHGLQNTIQEYQKGEKIFGICNVLEENFRIPMQLNKIVESYSYEVDCSCNQVKILTKLTSLLAVYTTSSEIIYQRKNQLIKKTYESGKEDIIYTIKNMKNFRISLQGNYLLVEDNEEYIPIQLS